jgi:hypothetical protein
MIILNEKCNKCVFKESAISRGANIFCTPLDGIFEHSIIVDKDAKDCEYFLEPWKAVFDKPPIERK